MKKRIIILILVFFIFYLLGSFYNISFNIREWSSESRFFVVLFGGFLSFTAATYPYLEDLK